MPVTVKDLLAKRGTVVDKMTALAGGDTMTAEQVAEFRGREAEVKALDEQVECIKAAQAAAAATAQPVPGQDAPLAPGAKAAASVEASAYVSDDAARKLAEKQGFGTGSARSIVFGGVVKSLALGGNLYGARAAATDLYGENHPVTKALFTGVGASGGFIVPPDYMNEIIELLRPSAVLRAAGPRTIPMPRGTMNLPGQAAAASASYGSETRKIDASQQGLNNIVASFKKLTALVPVSNDMMRYADPAVDAFVRDDLVKVVGLKQDAAGFFGDGSQDAPRGLLSFANGWVGKGAGTLGNWSTSANSTMAVNGSDSTNTTGGNFITSTASYTLATVAAELGGAVNRLDTANVPASKRVWFMHPRSRNFLYNVQNSLGVYVYRDELSKGTLSGYPVFTTTQIGTNYWDASGTNKDLSFVFLVEMTEYMILDSMQLELAVSREGSYVGSDGNTYSAFQNDQTLIRAIAEHDFQLRHDAAAAVIQGVRWAPAIL